MTTCSPCATCTDPAVAEALAALPPVVSLECGGRKGFPDTCGDPIAMSRTAELVASNGTPSPPTCCGCD